MSTPGDGLAAARLDAAPRHGVHNAPRLNVRAEAGHAPHAAARPARRRAPCPGARHDACAAVRPAPSDDGQVTILTIGVMVLALALVLVVAAATSVHLERKNLLAVADLAALDAADAGSDGSYFAPGAGQPGQPRVPLTDAAVRAGVVGYLGAHPPVGAHELQVVDASTTDGRSVHVTLRAVVHPALLVALLADWAPGVTVQVESSARAG